MVLVDIELSLVCLKIIGGESQSHMSSIALDAVKVRSAFRTKVLPTLAITEI